MAWTPLLLVLLSHCTGSLSQPVLTQPPSLSASPGASARLTCALSSGFSVGDFRITWLQQEPGGPPHYLLNYYSDSDKHQGSGVPSRFSGSKDTSANAGVLHISGLQPEDEAHYYCTTYHGGAGSQATVTQERSLSVSPGGTVTLTCGLGTGSVSTSHYPNCYQQTPDQPFRTLIYHTNSRPSGVPDRFTGSLMGNKATLTIMGAQIEDDAEYICELHMGSCHTQ
ncbi:Immunoglobulin omega chain [Tupaia chinensis]|nr:Immunoglobulin omega chain [Tupaia chinensis]